jgi:DNA mismatch repair ATPase MutL
VNLELTPPDYLLVKELADELAGFGFDIRDFGPGSILISGCPVDTGHADPAGMIKSLLEEYKSPVLPLKKVPVKKLPATWQDPLPSLWKDPLPKKRCRK